MSILNCTVAVEEDSVFNVFFGYGDPNHLKTILHKDDFGRKSIHVFPTNIGDPILKYLYEMRKDPIDFAMASYVISGFQSDMMGMVKCPGIPQVVKQMSLIHYYYKWTRRLSTGQHPVVNASMVGKLGGQDKVITPMEVNRNTTHDFKIKSAIILLGPAYSKQDQIYKQLMARINAAFASYCDTRVELAAVSNAAGEIAYKIGSRSSIFDEVAGWATAINDYQQWKPEITSPELANLAMLKDQGVLIHHWDLELLVQMRMVYSFSHMTTSKFALAALEPAKHYLIHAGEPFKVEMNRLNVIKPKLHECKYIGMQQTLPEAFQQNNFPRMSYIGVKYYIATLPEAGRKTMEDYAIPAIRERVPAQDIEMCETIIDLLESSRLHNLTKLLSKMPFITADFMIGKMSPEHQKGIIFILSHFEHPGEWYKEYVDGKRREAVAETHKKLQALLKSELETRVTSFRNVAQNIEDRDERWERVQLIEEWNNDIINKMADLQPIQEQVKSLAVPLVKEQVYKTAGEYAALRRFIWQDL